MPLFDIPTRATSRDTDRAIAKKSNTKVKSATKKSSGILALMSSAKDIVEEKLGHLKNEYVVIRTQQDFDNYIGKSIRNGVIAIDTETTGLDPICDKLVGLCLYTPNQKACYVPVNHVSYITNDRVENQLNEKDIAPILDKLRVNNTKIIMFNAQFDIRVIRNQVGVYLNCYWDCYLGARLLNENEPDNRLKKLHQKYVLGNKEDEFAFGELFKDITFDKVPIDTAYLYAAHDAIVTYELYKFQHKYLDVNSDRKDLADVAKAFMYNEMPVVDVVCDMEDTGVELDLVYTKELSTKYNILMQDKMNEINNEIRKYDKVINAYKDSHPEVKLDNPVNIASTVQLSTLLYDIFKVEPPDKNNPRGTSREILKAIDIPLCKLILEYRALAKNVTTYIDKLPTCINAKTGRIHCKFNQYGADTGRFSSEGPNLQNIPSHNTDIRKMFKATDGYVMMSSDYSQQEPKCLAALCRLAGDSQMYDVFMQGKDLYSEIASKAFHKSYEDCLEHFPKDTPIKMINKKWYYATLEDYDKLADGITDTYNDGKERRSQAKTILLGVLYGRGEESIAEQLKCSVDEARAIKESVFQGFPAIKKFEQDTLTMARQFGYVTTILGRKRRLYDMQLPQYEFKYTNSISNGDVLDFDNKTQELEVPKSIQDKYLVKIRNAGYYKRKVFEEANKEGIWIIDNFRKINDATRQCVNSRIQGSAADLTKAAMIALNNDDRAKKIGMRILIPVHDELIVECPKTYAKEGKELLATIMSQAAEKILDMPIKCDVTVTERWYGEELDLC